MIDQPIGTHGRGRDAALVVALLALLLVGAYGLQGYLRDYLLYRGFGPPISAVPKAQQGRIVTLRVTSAALGGAQQRVLVYLPADYARNTTRRYPVVYLLHGTPGDPRTAYVNSLHVAPRMDRLIAAGRVRPMIVAMPPGSPSTYNAATEWANGPGFGQGWFTYLTRDVVSAVDAHLRTIPLGAARGIGGFSSGANAALNAALLVPGRFGVAEGWSGDYRQAPATVGGVPALVSRFSAVATVAGAAHALVRTHTHVYLYVGAHDRVLARTLAVARALKVAGVSTKLAVTTGGHSWALWSNRMNGALQYFSNHLLPPR